MGRKIVKRLAFAFLMTGVLLAVPAAAQFGGGPPGGYDFINAVKKSDGNKALQVLGSHPAGIINARDSDGNTGLIIAINRSDEQWTGFLLNKGADPNLAGRGGDTPLIAAARIGFDSAVGWLLGLGTKVDATNRQGETALIVAVQQRQLPIVRALLSAGADPDRTDASAGYSARDYATRDPRARDILRLIEEKKPKSAAAAAK
jgi:ankyrin repeat protein